MGIVDIFMFLLWIITEKHFHAPPMASTHLHACYGNQDIPMDAMVIIATEIFPWLSWKLEYLHDCRGNQSISTVAVVTVVLITIATTVYPLLL